MQNLKSGLQVEGIMNGGYHWLGTVSWGQWGKGKFYQWTVSHS